MICETMQQQERDDKQHQAWYSSRVTGSRSPLGSQNLRPDDGPRPGSPHLKEESYGGVLAVSILVPLATSNAYMT